jgi:hypothetical protein
VPSVCEPFEERGGFPDEVVSFFDGLFDLDDVGVGEDWDGEGFGGIDHEDGEFELKIWVLRLFRIRAVEFEGTFV